MYVCVHVCVVFVYVCSYAFHIFSAYETHHPDSTPLKLTLCGQENPKSTRCFLSAYRVQCGATITRNLSGQRCRQTAVSKFIPGLLISITGSMLYDGNPSFKSRQALGDCQFPKEDFI